MTLRNLRVLDLAGSLAGAYCTKLLADAGADVVVLEPDEGAGGRWPEIPGLFDFLHTSKRMASLQQRDRLEGGADIVVGGSELDVAAARRTRPSQVVVTVSPYGTSGPWVGRPATEFTLQAASGSTGRRGLPGQTPLAAGGRVGEWMVGTYAAVGALAAWWRADHTGVGAHVDVAILDVMALTMASFPSVYSDFAEACGKPPMGATRTIQVPSIEPTADGWVTFTANSAQQFADFGVLIGHPEISEDERFVKFTERFKNREEFWKLTRAYTRQRTTETVLEEAGLLRIPVAPVLDGSTVATFEHFVARGVFVDHPSGKFRQPRIPFRLHGVTPRKFEPVPELGAPAPDIDWPSRPPMAVADGAPVLPLEGVRVVDLTAWWAGPCATQVLAYLGADVIKVESISRPDLMRCVSMKEPGEDQWWEWGPQAHAVNTNKRAITLDLTRPEGRDLVLRLCETADLLVENYTPRVMEQFGLTWDVIHQANPQLSMVRMPAFGLDGPWRDRPGFAQTMESLSGLAAATGWPGQSPVLEGGICDPIAGLHATFAALVTLCRRAEQGTGFLVEATMVEAALNAAAVASISYQLQGEVQGRLGNRSGIGSAPQGVYPCAGTDQWIAMEVENDRQWDQLVSVLGPPPTDAGDPSTPAGRQACHDCLDEWLGTQTAQWDASELAERMAQIGVPAAVVIAPRDVAHNPQLLHRGFFELEHHPVTGDHALPVLPFSMSGIESWIRMPSPMLGQHNDEVLSEVGVDEEGRATLRLMGIVGEELVGA